MKKQFGRFVLGICMMLLIAACAPLDMSTEELTARIQASMDSEINVHLIQETHFIAPEGAEGVEMFGPDIHVQETWTRDSEHSRHESRSADQPEHDVVFIQNSGQHIAVNLADNTYMTMDMMKFGSDENAEEVERPSAAEMIADAIENLDFTFLGAEEVAGRMTYKVTASPKENATDEFMMMGGTMTMWVDQETFYPLQNEYDMGGGMTAFTKATLVEFGVEMPDELFLPPAGAVEVDSLPGMPEQMTLEEAEAKAGFDVLSLPESDELKFDSATVMSAADFAEMGPPDADGEMAAPTEGFDVSLMYHGGRKFLHINQSSIVWPGMPEGAEMPEDVEMPEGIPMPEPVTIRGQEGETMTHFGSTNIMWTENGIRFSMGGNGLSLEELLELAESLK